MKWRRLAVTAGAVTLAGVAGILLVVTVNLMRFERAAVCSPSAANAGPSAASAAGGASRGCVQVSWGTIAARGRSVDNSWCGAGPAGSCHDRTDYSIVVRPAGSTRTVELWDTVEHPDFAVGDTVRLERWHGQYIAITNRGHRVEVNDWSPHIILTLVLTTLVSAAVMAPLWCFRVVSLENKPRGWKAKLRSVVGHCFLLYAAVLLVVLCYGTFPASSPLLYLR